MAANAITIIITRITIFLTFRDFLGISMLNPISFNCRVGIDPPIFPIHTAAPP
jgi:hypothetical protein